MRRRGINFLEKTSLEREKYRERKRIIRISFITMAIFVAVLLLEFGAVFALSRYNLQLTKKMEVFEEQINRNGDKESLAIYISDKLKAIDKVFSKQTDYGADLQSLLQIMPPGSKLENIILQQKTISFFLVLANRNDLAVVVNGLKQSQLFDLVEFSDISMEPSGGFSLNVSLTKKS